MAWLFQVAVQARTPDSEGPRRRQTIPPAVIEDAEDVPVAHLFEREILDFSRIRGGRHPVRDERDGASSNGLLCSRVHRTWGLDLSPEIAVQEPDIDDL